MEWNFSNFSGLYIICAILRFQRKSGCARLTSGVMGPPSSSSRPPPELKHGDKTFLELKGGKSDQKTAKYGSQIIYNLDFSSDLYDTSTLWDVLHDLPPKRERFLACTLHPQNLK